MKNVSEQNRESPAVILADLIGKPFRDGGRGPDYFDCWGLVVEVFKRFGYSLPDYQIACHNAERIASQADVALKCGWGGDWKEWIIEPKPNPLLVAFQTREPGKVNHVGVYIGNGGVIHILEKKAVCIEKISKYQKTIEGFYVYKIA